MEFEIIEGATPIDADQAQGLIPKNILLQSELNEWEQENITLGEIWLSRKKYNIEIFASIEFMKKTHQKMFDKTWKWAGTFRTSDTNIGICWADINPSLKNLCEDLKCQIKFKSYPIDEIAARFHHRLVSIHCFPNGNGRHARIVTDYLLKLLQQSKFTWGKKELAKATEARKIYIDALKQADRGNYQPLLIFVRE